MPLDHVYNLQRIQLLEEIKADLYKWLTGRFWIAGIVGIFGLNALITVTVYSLLKDDLRIATRAAALAEDATKDAKTSVEKSTHFVEKLKSQADTVDDRFKEVLSRLDAESTHSRQEALSEIRFITDRLNELETLTKQVATDTQEAREAYEAYQEKQSSILSAEIEFRTRFEENAKFQMSVLASADDRKLAEEIAALLSKEGFRAGVIEWGPFERPRGIDYGADAEHAAKRARDLIAPLLDGEKLPVMPVDLEERHYTKDYFAVVLNPEMKGS